LGLGDKNLVWERDKAIESSDRTSARSNVEGYRQHADNTLTVAEKKQFVLHTEEQIAAGIKFSGQDQLKSCVECFWEAAQQQPIQQNMARQRGVEEVQSSQSQRAVEEKREAPASVYSDVLPILCCGSSPSGSA
jgi:hypothetical protein